MWRKNYSCLEVLQIPGCVPKATHTGSSVSCFIGGRAVSLGMVSLGSSEFPASRWIQAEPDDLSSFVSVALTKHTDQSNVQKKEFVSSSESQSTIEGS